MGRQNEKCGLREEKGEESGETFSVLRIINEAPGLLAESAYPERGSEGMKRWT